MHLLVKSLHLVSDCYMQVLKLAFNLMKLLLRKFDVGVMTYIFIIQTYLSAD